MFSLREEYDIPLHTANITNADGCRIQSISRNDIDRVCLEKSDLNMQQLR